VVSSTPSTPTVVTLPVESITEQKLTSLMQKANQNLEKERTHLEYLFSNKEFFAYFFEGFKYIRIRGVNPYWDCTVMWRIYPFFPHQRRVPPWGAALPDPDSNPVSALRQADALTG
jgi:hypothetical protein